MFSLFRWGLVLISILWSLIVLPTEIMRIVHADVRQSVANEEPIERAGLDNAIASYGKLASFGICMPGVREQLSFLLSIRSTSHNGLDALKKTDDDLDRANQALQDMLACSPFESNQWLSLAMLDVERNGVRDKAFTFLELSYLTAPREGWIVERRLTFVANIAQFVPQKLRAQIHNDIFEMRRMGPIRRSFLKRINLKSLDDLERLFS